MKVVGHEFSVSQFVPPAITRFTKRGLEPNPLIPHVDESFESFSQYQEDVLVDSLLGFKDRGIYVDVGANDPIVLNNTYRFYRRGWHGINIEPNPELFRKLEDCRRRDVNINIGIGEKEQIMKFYEMSESTLSSFDHDSAMEGAKKSGNATLRRTIDVQVIPLHKVLSTHLGGEEIDLMSIDAEGYELHILKSNQWKMFCPRVMLIEMNHAKPEREEIIKLLGANNYKLVYNNTCNGIFLRMN